MLFLLATILYLTSSQNVCSSPKFWNPLNNACVNRTTLTIKNAHGLLPNTTTLTPPPTPASSLVQPLLLATATTSLRAAWLVQLLLYSLSLDCRQLYLLR